MGNGGIPTPAQHVSIRAALHYAQSDVCELGPIYEATQQMTIEEARDLGYAAKILLDILPDPDDL